MDNNAAITTAHCRRAVATIIRDLQAQHGLSDLGFAEEIGCSVNTIRNSRNEESELSAMYLARIEKRFGAGSCDPYHALSGARAVPVEARPGADILPLIGRVNLSIAEARDPDSPGGAREILRERLGYLPYLKVLAKELGATIVEIEAERDAA